MDHATATRLVRQLRQVTVEHGATVPEAAVAAAKADLLTKKYGLEARTRTPPPPRRRARPMPAKDFADWVGGSAHAQTGAWSFDYKTGRASANVKVHSYTDRRNWRIEIPL